MYYGELRFERLPKVGFAHHFHTEQYHTVYGRHHTGFEVAYIHSGSVQVEFSNEIMTAPAGSVLVLFRELPLVVTSTAYQSHSTVQVDCDCSALVFHTEGVPQANTLLLPFVTPPCAENEIIKKKLHTIISARGISREDNEFHAALEFLEVLRLLDKAARTACQSSKHASPLGYQIKRFIAQNLNRAISLNDIAEELKKTPNYLNRVFREVNGVTITQYINQQKAERIASLISKQKISFKLACDNVGITDITYGYRLFKKHIGVTPKQYIHGASLSNTD